MSERNWFQGGPRVRGKSLISETETGAQSILMGSDGWIETLLPKQFIQKVLRKRPNRPFEQRLRRDLFKRPDYAYGVYRAALQAQALGIARISAIEFSVPGGKGLLALEESQSK